MRESLSLTYKGARLRTGMEAEDLASAIEGFASIVRLAGSAMYGDTPRTDFRVSAVRPGSLSISFLLEVAGIAQTLSMSLPAGISSAAPLFDLLKQWFDLLGHLQGKPPANVQRATGSSNVQVQNTSGNVKVFQKNVYNTFNFHDIGRYSERMARPLHRGSDALDIKVGDKTAARVTRRDAGNLRSVRRVEETLEIVSEVFLKVVSPVFEGSAAWRFSRDRNVITATVEDASFLASVQSGQASFRAGDVLKVRLRSTQEKAGKKIREFHMLEKVLSHEGPASSTQASFHS